VAITRLDWAGRRYSFSRRRTLADPWETARGRFPAGSRHVGKVARLNRVRAFISFGGGVDGPPPHLETRRGKSGSGAWARSSAWGRRSM